LRSFRHKYLQYEQGNFLVSLIEGDGIGPEIAQSVKDIFAAAKVRLISNLSEEEGKEEENNTWLTMELDPNCLGAHRRQPHHQGRQDRHSRRCD
jgi:hypothetical protein